MRTRIKDELALLRKQYPEIEHKEHAGEDWFRIPRYHFPPGWRIGEDSINTTSISFKVSAAYPGSEPYAFLTPEDINFKGSQPNNTSAPVTTPFEGTWRQFSWAPDGWVPASEVRNGQNLLIWVRSFAKRLKDGI